MYDSTIWQFSNRFPRDENVSITYGDAIERALYVYKTCAYLCRHVPIHRLYHTGKHAIV